MDSRRIIKKTMNNKFVDARNNDIELSIDDIKNSP